MYSNKSPTVICNWKNVPKDPRILDSASSATYIGAATLVAPVESPAMNLAAHIESTELL